MQPDGHHIAELNVGHLIALTDDPRLVAFSGTLRCDRLAMEAKA